MIGKNNFVLEVIIYIYYISTKYKPIDYLYNLNE